MLSAAGVAVLVAAVWLGGNLARESAPPEPREVGRGPLPAPSCRDVLCALPWPVLEAGSDGVYAQWVEGRRVIYTVDPELQEQALAVFRRYKIAYGAFVAVEPRTGKVLALAEYSHRDPDLRDFCRRAAYPAASLIKVVTAAAALETGAVTPSTRVRFEGNPYRLYRRKISPKNRRRENNVTTLAEALGKSNNVVFGKVGVDVVGGERLQAALEAFGFNREIPFDFPLERSHARVPTERYPLARTAAGFGEVYLSPVHAALIAAAVGNGGLMMQPYVVDRIEDDGGRVLYRAAPAPFARATSPEIARQVGKMMVQTVTRGTSAKVFYRYARRLRRDVGVAGKTGSLTGKDPPGKYEWFIGYAPLEDPQVAVASLVVNQGDLWHIKGTYLAQAVMKEFFGM
ncbi:MAG: penicillin-binding transpeptidase domain-containing protein [Deferrisomatales bacterium]